MSTVARCFASLILIVLCGSLLAAQSVSLSEEEISQFKYRHIGPIGNRVAAVVGVPGDPRIYYIGAASGGVFKTIDSGASWEPVFDDQEAQAIGSLAIARSDPNVVWAGTGETNIRSNISVGNGIYRSTDAGKTWKRMGLEQSGRIGRIIIHPTNPEIVWAAALGHCYGPQPERGVYKTVDGGENWTQVLFVDQDTGAVELAIDPSNPRTLFAGMWQMEIRPWGRFSGGPGSGIYKSTDSGDTWVKLEGHGLPKGEIGKTALSISPDDPNRVYALIETNVFNETAPVDEHDGVLWSSDDGGESWRMTNADHTLSQRPHYYTRLLAAPDDADEVHFMAVQHSLSLDGGKTFTRLPSGGDHHDIWIDPLIPDRIIVGHDQGIGISSTRGRSWLRPQLPIAQMYHVATDNEVPYFVYGNRQDGASARGPSNTLTGGSIPVGEWHSVGGCESGFAVPDPVDSNIVWSGCYEGILDRYDHRSGHSRNVMVWPDNPEANPGELLKYRFQWTFPITISPHNHNRVYVGSQYVHVTENEGQSWTVISPDLTGNDKAKQKKFGGLTPDDEGPTLYPTVFAIAESLREEGQIWAGTNDGRVQVTRDAGQSWTDVTSNIPGVPPDATVSNIEPSRHVDGKTYLAFDRHQMGDTRPYIFKTQDYGASWTAITNGIPESVLSYTHVVREDPKRPGLLYAGTENGLYISFDDGSHWQSFQSNLPHAPVHWLTIQEHFNDLVVATYGRGFWILDDITPLQQFGADVAASDLHLFEPRPAYRFRSKEGSRSQPGDPAAGENPEYGAAIHYFLPNDVEEKMKIEIVSGSEVVRALSVSDSGRKKGINRVYWDLRFEETERPKLRTLPEEHAHVTLGKDGVRRLSEGRTVAILAPPGTYTVRVWIAEETWETSLEVRKDPNSAGTVEDILVQTEAAKELRAMVVDAAAIVEEIEDVRRQLYDLVARIEDQPELDPLVEQAGALDDALKELEGVFFDLRLSGARQDTLWWGRRLYSKMTILASVIGQSDFRPTDQQLEVSEVYKEELDRHQRQMEQLRIGDIARFNDRLREMDIANILTRKP